MGLDSRSRPFLILKDKGVPVSESITRTELETLVNLAEVVQGVDVRAPIRYLTEAECEQVVSGRSRATPANISLSA